MGYLRHSNINNNNSSSSSSNEIKIYHARGQSKMLPHTCPLELFSWVDHMEIQGENELFHGAIITADG